MGPSRTDAAILYRRNERRSHAIVRITRFLVQRHGTSRTSKVSGISARTGPPREEELFRRKLPASGEKLRSTSGNDR